MFALIPVPFLPAMRRSIVVAWFDILQSYRRTIFGPFWLTMNMAIFAGAITLVYSALFGMEIGEYAGYVVAGVMMWWWVMGVLNDGGALFISYQSFLQSMHFKKATLIWAMAVRQGVALLHHLTIYLLLVIVGVVQVNWNTLMFIPAILLLFVWSIPVIGCLAVIFARYRDVQKLVGAATIILMMVTPVFWQADMISGWRTLVFELNPVYYAIELARRPLLGQPVPPEMWMVAGALALATWVIGGAFYRRYSRYIVFWL